MSCSSSTRAFALIAGRDEIHVLQRQINRAQSTETDRTILAVLVSVFDRRRLADVMRIMQPATVLGRHRRLVARQWTQPPARKRGRLPIADRRSPASFANLFAASLPRTRPGDTGVSTANSAGSATASPRRACGTSCTKLPSIPHPTGPDRGPPTQHGTSSWASAMITGSGT